ncbi:Bor/Iss family lipoprotein [Spirosoma aerophilum]
MISKKRLWVHQFTLVALLFLTQSCYHYRITTSRFDPSTGYQKKTAHSFFWGLVQKNVIATNCDSLNLKSLDEVRMTTNFGYSLITVATLGIWSPVRVEWKCPKPCPREGEL